MAKKTKKIFSKIAAQPPQKKPEAENEQIKKIRIKVVGIGGGGGSIVSEISSRLKKVSFVVSNTDVQALKGLSKKVAHFSFGEQFTHGLGTGMNPELAELAALNEKEKIKKILAGNDLIIIVACLGGGTGSGASPVFAKIAKDLGSLTYGIFTLPFPFEGSKKMEIAGNSLEKIKPNLNAFSLIPNERIFQIVDKNTPLKRTLSAINKAMADSLEGLIETIYDPGLINIDFSDLKTILEGRGRLSYLNTVEIKKDKDSNQEIAKKILNSPLYPYGIRGAKGVLMNINGEKELSLSEVSNILKSISELANKEAKIIVGVSQNSNRSQGTIKTTLLATGCLHQMAIYNQPVSGEDSPENQKKENKANKENKKKKKSMNPKNIKRNKKNQKSKAQKKSLPQKIKVTVEQEKEILIPSENETKNLVADFPQGDPDNPFKGQFRKNALQVRKELDAVEKEMQDKEKFWETPTFLRKKID